MGGSNMFESFERRVLLSAAIETEVPSISADPGQFNMTAQQVVGIEFTVQGRSYGSPGATLKVQLASDDVLTGSVRFFRDDQLIGTVAVGPDNTASFEHLGPGEYAFRAEYSGDDTHAPAISATKNVTVEKTYLGYGTHWRADDGSVVVSYNDYAIKPTGTIYFINGPTAEGGTVFATAELVDGVAVLKSVPSTPPVYIAFAYSGDENYHQNLSRIDFIPMPYVDSRPVNVEIIPPSKPVIAGALAEYTIQLVDPDLSEGEWFSGSLTIEMDGEGVRTIGVHSSGITSVKLALDAGHHTIKATYNRDGVEGRPTDPFHTSGAVGTVDVEAEALANPSNDKIASTVDLEVVEEIDPTTGMTVSFVGDVNGNGTDDQVIYNRNARTVWLAMDGANTVVPLQANPVAEGWRLAGVADFDGDGFADLLWTHDELRKQSIWNLKGRFVAGFSMLNHAPKDNAWVIESVEDLDGDGDADLLWRNVRTGGAYAWLMQGTKVIGGMIPA